MAKFSFTERVQSFKHAFNGLKVVLREEANFRIHFIAAIISIALGFWLDLSILEWLLLVVAIGGVLAAEIFNSAIENVADAVTKKHNESIKKAKDMAAAGVFIMSIVALLIGLTLFLPKILDLLKP